MKRILRSVLGIVLTVMMLAAIPASRSYAYSEQPYLFDFGDACISVSAGSEYTMWFKSYYDYTYFIEGATSDGTYLDCSFSSGSQYITFHIGADEQGKNVFFHFYVNDSRLDSQDAHDCVEVYVQNIAPVNSSLAAPIADGKVGTLRQNGKVSMLYNEAGTPMASFSLGYGNGNMASYGQVSIVNNGSANYFALSTGRDGAYPKISESDKAVMIANGYAGVAVNGMYKNWEEKEHLK